MSSNQQRITKGFQILTRVLAPYVAGTLREEWGDQWWRRGVFDVFYDHRKRDLPPTGTDGEVMKWLDHGLCFLLMDIHWNDLFRSKLSRDCRTWIKELSNTRNKWAHPGFLDPSDDDTWRALDTMARLADRVEPDTATRLRALARTVRYGNEGPSTATGEANTPKLATPPRRPLHQPAPQATRTPEASPAPPAARGVLTDVPRSGLKPWREVARPHPDVAAGRYRQAEFAADLAQVVNRSCRAERSRFRRSRVRSFANHRGFCGDGRLGRWISSGKLDDQRGDPGRNAGKPGNTVDRNNFGKPCLRR